MSTTITSKGQVTIPKRVRDLFDLQPGTEVEFTVGPKSQIVLVRADGKPLESRIAKLIGHAGPGLTTDEVMALTRGDD